MWLKKIISIYESWYFIEFDMTFSDFYAQSAAKLELFY